jgi:hypothetical protein
MSPERVISIAISESDWKVLRSVQPEPVDWLKGKIRETVEQARRERPSVEAAPAPPQGRAQTAGSGGTH